MNGYFYLSRQVLRPGRNSSVKVSRRREKGWIKIFRPLRTTKANRFRTTFAVFDRRFASSQNYHECVLFLIAPTKLAKQLGRCGYRCRAGLGHEQQLRTSAVKGLCQCWSSRYRRSGRWLDQLLQEKGFRRKVQIDPLSEKRQ